MSSALPILMVALKGTDTQDFVLDAAQHMHAVEQLSSSYGWLLSVRLLSCGSLEGWHDLSISAFPSSPPYFHLICLFPSRISHFVDPIYPIRRHLESRALQTCHPVHLIYPITSHLGFGRARQASRPSHLPSCHLKMEIDIWVFTSFPGRASPQGSQQHCQCSSTSPVFVTSVLYVH